MHHKLLMLGLLLLAGLAHAAAVEPIVVGACNACDLAQLRSTAVTVSSLHAQAGEVYLLDVDRRLVHRYAVQAEDDGAQWRVVVTALPTDTPAAAHIRAYWQALDQAAGTVVLPDESYGTPTGRAADLLNAAARWNAVHRVAQSYSQRFQQSPDAIRAAHFVNQSVATEIALGRPVVATAGLRSGAQFKVRLTPAVNDLGGTEFLAEFVEGSFTGADGAPMPMTRDGLDGYRYRGGDPQTVRDLLEVLQRLGATVANAAAASGGGSVAIACSTVDGQPACSVENS